MYCSNCGKEISEESVFCKYCGKPQGEVSGKADYSAAPKRPQISINYKKVALIVCPIAVFAALVIVGIVLFRLYIRVPSVSSTEFTDVCDAMGAREVYTTEIVNNGYYLEEQIGPLYENNLEEGFYITVDDQFLNASEEYGYLMRIGLPGLAGLGNSDIEEISYFAISDTNTSDLGQMINGLANFSDADDVQFDILNAAQITLSDSERAEAFMDSLSYWLNMVGVDTDDLRFWEFKTGKTSGILRLHLDLSDVVQEYYLNSDSIELLQDSVDEDYFDRMEDTFADLDGSVNIFVCVKDNNIVIAVSITCNEDADLMSDFCSGLNTADLTGFRTNKRVAESIADTCDRWLYYSLAEYIWYGG